MRDLKLQFTLGDGDTNGNGIVVCDGVTGKKMNVTNKYLLTGRMTDDGSHYFGRRDDGYPFTAVLGMKDGQLCAINRAKLYTSDNNQPVNIPFCPDITSRRQIVFPTLVNNADPNEAQYVKLIAFGDNAIQLANTTRGSSVIVIGEPKECVVGKEVFEVFFVNMLLHNKKGGQNVFNK